MELADRTDHLPLSFLPVFQWYDARTSAKGFSACYTFRIEAQFLEFGIKKIYIYNKSQSCHIKQPLPKEKWKLKTL